MAKKTKIVDGRYISQEHPRAAAVMNTFLGIGEWATRSRVYIYLIILLVIIAITLLLLRAS